MFKINSIRRTYFISLFLTALILLIIISLFFVYQKYRDFEKEAEREREKYVEYQKTIIKDQVNRAIDFIEFYREKVKEQVRKGEDYKDIENKIKQDIITRIQKIKFGEGGYIFISQYNGIVLAHHRPEHIGSDLSDLTDPNGIKIHQVILQAGKKPGGGFTEYVGTKNPVTGKPGEKITFVRSIDDWKWLVSAGFYADNIEPIISANREQLAKSVNLQLLYIILIFLIITAIAALIINKLSQRISKQFNLLTKYFQRSATTYEKIDKDKLPYEEFKVLSDSVNEMVDERKQAEKHIIHLNSVLIAIRNVNQLIVIEKNRKKLLQKACDILIKTRGYDAAWLGFLKDSETFSIVKGSGFEESISLFCENVIKGDHPICIKNALMRKDLLTIVDKSRECEDCFFKNIHKSKVEIIIRIEYDSRLYGLLAISFVLDVAVDDDERLLLKEVASDIAFALYSIELEENRKQTEKELKKHREHLEELVKERTKELEEKNKELEHYNRLFEDREFRIKELKDKIKELEKRMNRKA